MHGVALDFIADFERTVNEIAAGRKCSPEATIAV
jgi:hypothetical protein